MGRQKKLVGFLLASLTLLASLSMWIVLSQGAHANLEQRGYASGLSQIEEQFSYLPLILKAEEAFLEWSQHAHNAQRTSYTPQTVAPPWRWRWSWNGANSTGGLGKVTSNGTLPRNVQPVTGGGRVYIAAGEDGVYALDEASGIQRWNRRGIGAINSTVAFDHSTQAVFALSANGTLYKLDASSGNILGQYAAGATSHLPLPPALLKDRVIFAMGKKVFALNKQNLTPIWVYDAGVEIETPPSYSSTRDLVVVGARDLFVHAIRNTNGTQKWRVRPVHPDLAAGETANRLGFAEYRYGWPVIAEKAGYVLIKVRLDWESLWHDYGITNQELRQLFMQNPKLQALFVLDLDDGSLPFIANIGHGGYGDQDYLPMGPQPVVKPLSNGKEIVYTVIRGHLRSCHDARWDSHFGEMVLDDTSVSGLTGGEVRWIAYAWQGEPAVCSFLLTDEQPNVSMAGDVLFGGHWEAGFSMRILDRSDSRGSFYNRITTQYLPTIVTSQDSSACPFSPTHYCPLGLENTRSYNYGFYIYYRQGAVYDQYWSEYLVWTVSNQNVYFRSTDGAIVALTSGNPEAQSDTSSPLQAAYPRPALIEQSVPAEPEARIWFSEARSWAGRPVVVSGQIEYLHNNGKNVMLAFSRPHQGHFKVLIPKTAWGAFASPPETLYHAGQVIQVSGVIRWYQGDPVIYVSDPEQIR